MQEPSVHLVQWLHTCFSGIRRARFEVAASNVCLATLPTTERSEVTVNLVGDVGFVGEIEAASCFFCKTVSLSEGLGLVSGFCLNGGVFK